MSHSNSPITSSKAYAKRAAPLPNAYEQDGYYYDALDLPKVAGILYKWVNIGKGWKARWFCLEDGVLSYYKIRGPDRISISPEKLKNLRIIGEEAQRLLRKQKNTTSVYEKRPKRVLGELHLKVSSFRESKSDDRRFYVYTGTKTLYLRAESKEDKASWLEAFQWAKELFPRSYSSADIVLPSEVPTMSTGRLCQKLQELGVSSDGIKECEDIVLSEFQKLQQKLQDMRQKQLCLIEKLRYLEVEKFDLETTVVDEMQSQVPGGSAVGSLKDHVLNLLGASETDSDDESVQPYTGADSEDEDNTFFDTQEVFVDSSHSPSFPDDTLATELALSVGFGYPVIERRKKLPDPKEQEKAVSLWSMIRDNIGKDLSKVCLPVYFNEPLSTLQKCFEDLEYSQLLDQAQEWGKKGDGLMRMLHVAAFAVSSYSSTEGRLRKPFNPLLGETYEADYPDKGLRFVSEKVSHHPMVIACHCEGRGWKFWGDSMLKSKFWGRSIELNPVGILTLEFDDGEVFQWSKVTSSINNLILGKLYVDHYGTMRIQGNRQFSCKMKFKEQSLLEKNPHQVQGYVQRADGENVATLIGKWDESICYVLGDPSTKPNTNEARLLWKKNKPPTFPTRYNLTSFAITLNEITPGLKEKLPRTDSRLRPDQCHLENGEYEQANVEKQRLEHKQRQARKIQETGWVPKWFSLDKGTFCYKGGYWEAREFGQWQNCPDIFGPDPVDEGLYKD